WDRSPGPFHGRAYLIYANSTATDSPDTNIFVRFSDNGGRSWSAPIKVNDDLSGRTHILPRIAVDQTTGTVAASWYDARNDTGAGGAADVDGLANTDLEFFGSASFMGGACWVQNIQITPFASSARINANSGNDFGDYTGLAFEAGVFHPAWTDNS